MKAIRVIIGLIGVFIRIPIWYFLLYTLLKAVLVDRLVWFLFWIYVPLGIFLELVELTVKNLTEEK
jgi:hypothetical protein